MDSQVVRRRLIVTGRVQGVFFRDSTRAAAEHAGVHGWALNRPDGSLEIVLEGPPAAVESVIAFCRQGPDKATIEDVEVHEEEPEGLTGFEIR